MLSVGRRKELSSAVLLLACIWIALRLISASVPAWNLDVTMDNQLSFTFHFANPTRSCQCSIYNLNMISRFWLIQATQLWYWTAATRSWQVEPFDFWNAASRLWSSLSSPHSCIPTTGILVLAYVAKNGEAPSYLKSLITPSTAPRSLRSLLILRSGTARLVSPSFMVQRKLQSGLCSVLFYVKLSVNFCKCSAWWQGSWKAADRNSADKQLASWQFKRRMW